MKTINVHGNEVPGFIYGTAWKEERTKDLTLDAIKAGFRAVDTANQRRHYYEKGVGDALQIAFDTNLLKREDLFIQTKFTYQRSQDHRLPYDPKADYSTQVQQSFASSLRHLNVDYLNSYILHGPFSYDHTSEHDLEVWQSITELYKTGKTKLIGISNHSYDHLQYLLKNSEVKPHFLQNRCYARNLWDKRIRNLCHEHGIVYQGFSLLTVNKRELFGSPVIGNIAKSYDCTIPQLIFRFAHQLDMIPLTGTTNRKNMQDDLKMFDLKITEEDMARIENIALQE